MIKRPLTSTRMLLVTSASVLALAACSPAAIAEKFSGQEGRKAQVVDGERRSPMLNPKTVAPEPQVQAPAPAPAAPQASLDKPANSDFFSSYDQDGNAINPEVETAFSGDMEQAPKSPEPPQENLLAKWFGGQDKPKAPDADRKPFVAAAAEKPLLESDPAMTAKQAEFAPVAAAAGGSKYEYQPVKVALPPEPAPMLDEPEKPSFFSRMMAPFKAAAKEEPVAAPAPAAPAFETEPVVVKTEMESDVAKASAKDEPYPMLSSVPENPAQFKTVKAEKEQGLQQLKMDHALAQDSKQSLSAEPSQMEVAAPLAEAPPPPAAANPLPMASTEPSAEPVLLGQMTEGKKSPAEQAPAVKSEDPKWWQRWNVMGDNHADAPAPAAAPVMAEPVVLDMKKPEAPVAEPVVIATPEEAAPAKDTFVQKAEEVQAEEPMPEPKQDNSVVSWWNNLTKRSEESEPMVVAPEPVVAPVSLDAAAETPVQVMPPVAAPASANEPAPFVPVPLLGAQSAPEENLPGEQAQAPAPASSDSALPSPEVLKKVKTLPPSRYNSRARDRQFYLVP